MWLRSALLAALAAPVALWASPAAASVEPPPADADAPADDAPAADPANADPAAADPASTTAAPDAASPRETPDAPAADATARETPDPASAANTAEPAAPAAAAAASAAASAATASATATSAAAASASLTAHREPAPWSGSPRIGAGLDLGLPDGATASIVVRPIRSIRAHAGLSHNAISLGERVGLTWVPLSWWVSPTLSVEYGHYAEGNANPLVRMVSGDKTFDSAVLDRVGYDYANGHLGLEFGRRWFTFYVHAGYSRITGTVHNLTAEAMSQSAGTTSISFSKDPSVRLWSVSARVGFIVYLAK